MKLDLHRVWMREEGDFDELNEAGGKSDKILKNLEVPKITRIVLNMHVESRKELFKNW